MAVSRVLGRRVTLVPEQKLVQGSFLSWKDLRFLRSLPYLSVPNEDPAWMPASFLFIPSAIGVGCGPEARDTWCLSGDLGASLHPARLLRLELALPALPLCVPGRPLGLWIYPLGAAEEVGELCSASLARAHQ